MTYTRLLIVPIIRYFLKKIQFNGIRSKMEMLIQSYLTNRHQKVISSNVSLTWKKVQCGVLQGSILGPLLFLICVNDLPSIISKNNHTMLLYTYDTSLVITESSSTALKQQATSLLNDINSWFKSNFLLLNLNKTQYLEFSTKKIVLQTN